MRFSLRIYRLLLRLYPAGFREDYTGPLQRQFKDDYSDVRGWPDLVRFWVRTVLDFVRSWPEQLAREIAQDARHAVRVWRRRARFIHRSLWSLWRLGSAPIRVSSVS